MMRELRLCLFFAVGLVLGGGAVSSFAAVSDYGRSMRLNAPPSSGARFTGAPIYDWADAPDGWGKMKDINKINIGGKAFDVTGGRLFSPQNLAKGAVSFVRFGGPAWLGFMVAGLVWDEVTKRWLKPDDGGAPMTGVYYWSSGYGTVCKTVAGECTWQDVVAEMNAFLYAGGRYVDPVPVAHDVANKRYKVALRLRPGWGGSVSYAYINYGGVAPVEQVPATDQDLEDAIYVELVARGMGSDLARRLIEAGYNPSVDGIEIDGPSSIPGGSSTTTTTGPAGQTTTTTNTTHNITYNTNTTNNTSTVTVTTTNTSTTVAPDGTTTETTTESPAEDGETPPPEEPTPFCEQYPDASACQPLGDTQDEEIGEESVNVLWSQEGGAGGSCPAPIQATILGTQYAIEWTPVCAVASGIRPIVIGLAWLSAALWLFLMARARA